MLSGKKFTLPKGKYTALSYCAGLDGRDGDCSNGADMEVSNEPLGAIVVGGSHVEIIRVPPPRTRANLHKLGSSAWRSY